MKRILSLMSVAGVAVMLYAIPAVAENGTPGLSDEYGSSNSSEFSGQQSEKNQCLLVAMNCNGMNDTVPQRIEKLKKEIDKGSSVYTPEELDQLNRQLDWLSTESATEL